MEPNSVEDMSIIKENVNKYSSLIIQSVKTLAKPDGVPDKAREEAFKFLNSIIVMKFRFPDNLMRSLHEIIIGVNMNEKFSEFILLKAVDTLDKLVTLDPKTISDKQERKFMLAYVDRFKHFIRNFEKYSKSLIEAFLRLMLRIVTVLDQEGVGTIYPFLSVTTVKALNYILSPTVPGMLQTYMIQIWQMACLKVLGDHTIFVKKYCDIPAEEIKDCELTLEKFIKVDSEDQSKTWQPVPSKDLDKPWFSQCVTKTKEWLANIEKNFYKIIEKNNLKVLSAMQEFCKNLAVWCSDAFVLTDHIDVFLIIHWIHSYWNVYLSEEGVKHFKLSNTISVFPGSDHFLPQIAKLGKIVEKEIEKVVKEFRKVKDMLNLANKTTSLLRLESLFKYATDLGVYYDYNVIKKLYISMLQICEFKNPKVTIVKENTGLSAIFNAQELHSEQLLDDVQNFICSQITFLEGNMDTYFGFSKMISQFSGSICEQMYSEITNDIDTIDANIEFAHKAFGYTQKCRIYFILVNLMNNTRHDLHEKCLVFILEKMRDSWNITHPIQKTYVTLCLMVVHNCLAHAFPESLKLKNKVFTEVFTLLSHKFDSVKKAALLNIDIIKTQENCATISEIIESRQGVFWANIFSTIKYLDIDTNTMKISLVFKSLKTYGHQTFKANLDRVIEYLWTSFDHFFDISDWPSLLVIFELIVVTTELVNQYVKDEKEFTNGIKNMILRLKPFFVSIKHKSVVYSSLEAFKNWVAYLSQVGFDPEEATNFSDEDGPNVICSDGLSILAYKIYPDLIHILKTSDFSDPKYFDTPGTNVASNHIWALRIFREINRYRKEFLVTGHRFYEGKFWLI